MNYLIIVPCGQRKIWDKLPNAGPTRAKDAYTGAPFVVNKAFAERFSDTWMILSAKYGFVAPEFLIPGPYNVTFRRQSSRPVSVATLREQVRQLELGTFTGVIGLGGKEYRRAVERAFEGTDLKVHFPFAGLPIGRSMQEVKRAMTADRPLLCIDGSRTPTQRHSKQSTGSAVSSGVNELCHAVHALFTRLPRLRSPFVSKEIPRNGIYLVFESEEFAHGTDRIVRVGTHTGNDQLRSRLHQHFLHENKDRSIFRKNVGRCLLTRDRDAFLDAWEVDLTSRSGRTKYTGQIDFAKQTEIEDHVSRYMRQHLSVSVFEVPEKARRLELESKIASTLSLCRTCRPSQAWLGNHSPKARIRESGLWQVNELYKTPLSEADLVQLRNVIGLVAR